MCIHPKCMLDRPVPSMSCFTPACVSSVPTMQCVSARLNVRHLHEVVPLVLSTRRRLHPAQRRSTARQCPRLALHASHIALGSETSQQAIR